MDRDIIKAIKETRDFTLANLQIQKEILFELKKLNREKELEKLNNMDDKNGNN